MWLPVCPLAPCHSSISQWIVVIVGKSHLAWPPAEREFWRSVKNERGGGGGGGGGGVWEERKPPHLLIVLLWEDLLFCHSV